MEDMGTPVPAPRAQAPRTPPEAPRWATSTPPGTTRSSTSSAITRLAGLRRRNVVELSPAAPPTWPSVPTTPNLSYITPNLCNDGHDSPCVDGRPGGLVSADAWLRQRVPMILDSPAFKQDGMLVITFDEAEGNATGPASGIPGGTAGGRIGALVLSPQVKGGTSSDTLYNHFSLLASIEDIFSLPYLGYAGASGLNRFGSDVFNAG